MRIYLLLSLTILVLAACTQSGTSIDSSAQPTNVPTSAEPTPSLSSSPSDIPTLSPIPSTSSKPVEVKKFISPSPSSSLSAAASKQPAVQGNSTTNINITSNNTNVEVFTKEGKRYARLNGKDVQLDEKGCYKYDDGSTSIESCVNSQ